MSPVKIITVGGAKLNANDVASSRKETKNGKTNYVINFKDGATVRYPAQSVESNARINVSSHGNSPAYRISAFCGLEFSGTQKPEDIDLYGCQNCTVDVKDTDTSCDTVYIYSNPPLSGHNEVIMDETDETYFREDGITHGYNGPGTYHEGDDESDLL